MNHRGKSTANIYRPGSKYIALVVGSLAANFGCSDRAANGQVDDAGRTISVQAIQACEGKAASETCSYDQPEQTITGTCTTGSGSSARCQGQGQGQNGMGPGGGGPIRGDGGTSRPRGDGGGPSRPLNDGSPPRPRGDGGMNGAPGSNGMGGSAASITACEGKATGDSCEYISVEQSINGACAAYGENSLYCSRQGGGGRRLSTAAYQACTNKSEKASCNYTSSTGAAKTGTCTKQTDGRLACL